jgi:hypothetical protein
VESEAIPVSGREGDDWSEGEIQESCGGDGWLVWHWMKKNTKEEERKKKK